jgi:hypothetical protein
MTAAPAWTPAIPAAGMTRREADRVTAIACAVRLGGITAASSAGGTGKDHRAERSAVKLAEWLARDADDHHAAARRAVLCLACDLAAAGADADDITATADWMLKFVDDA